MSGLAAKCLAALAFAIGVATSAPGVAMAETKGKKAVPIALADVKGIGAKLKSQDPGKIAEGLDAAQKSGSGAAAVAPAIEDILWRGATNDLTKAAIEALGAIGDPSASPVLRVYVRHRSQDVRRAAIKALAATKGRDAIVAFKEGLRASSSRRSIVT
jgi:HEAT repeat protein